MNHFEDQLVSKLKNGDQESFTLLFELYGKKIYNLAFKMCGNKEDSEDIVQKTFIQAVLNINNFKEESSVYTWLYTIAKNLCLRLLEKRKKSSFSALDSLIHSVQSKEGLDNFKVIEKQHYISQVKEGCLLGLLRCLSFYQRIAFILSVLLEVKVKDTAIIINKSESAVRILIHRAKQNLKAFLCKNCSLYDVNNPCQCENLINFSIKQNWVRKITGERFMPKSNNDVDAIENEIDSLKKITRLYNSLEDDEPSLNILNLIQKEINDKSYKIFSDKKVK
ncbi:MAG TPA: RNA polymerase sigma factor [Clostridia bacterium]